MNPRRMMLLLALAVGLLLFGAGTPVWAGDTDGDGVDDAFDFCNNTPAGTPVDGKGRPLGDVDHDCDTDLDDYALFQQGMTGALAPSIPPGMVFIPGGAFEMGCHAETGETCSSDQLPVHEVYVDAFYMDVYEVTNQQYCDYLNWAYGQGLIEVIDDVVYKAGDSEPYCDTYTGTPDSQITWDGSTFGVRFYKWDHPMVMVSWYGAVAYCNWRSSEDGRTPCYDLETWECDFGANGYRLPTEAEWEYAARGGEHDPYYAYPWGNTIDGSQANYAGSGDIYEVGPEPYTTPVGYYDGGQSPPGVDMANGYGLYDMAGNVWERCNDWYSMGYYMISPYHNPHGPATASLEPWLFPVLRGGSWFSGATILRCAIRSHGGEPENRAKNIGFRTAAGA